MDKKIPFFGWIWTKEIDSVSQAIDQAKQGSDPLSDVVDAEVVIFPQNGYISRVYNTSGSFISVGSQNISYEDNPRTGELSIESLVKAKGRCVILGYSGQRDHGETYELVNRRLRAIIEYNIHKANYKISPIICVGENKQQRENQETKEVLYAQLTKALENFPKGDCEASPISNMESIVIAYDPGRAIEPGETISFEEAQKIHNMIRDILFEVGKQNANCSEEMIKQVCKNFAQGIRIIYGGPVEPGNIDDFMVQPDIDGALVSNNSINAEHFPTIVRKGKDAFYMK